MAEEKLLTPTNGAENRQIGERAVITWVVQKRFGLKKRTSNVRFAPNSGRNGWSLGMSAYDPKRSLMTIGSRVGPW